MGAILSANLLTPSNWFSPTGNNTSVSVSNPTLNAINTLPATSALPSNSTAADMRVRLSTLAPLSASAVSQGSLGPTTGGVLPNGLAQPAVGNYPGALSVLNSTGGMLFPYTPSITFTQGVDYMALQLTHSNTDYQAYTRTPSVKIGVTGKFTVQNQAEGAYAMAVLHFLRVVSKSYFGVADAATNNAGMPPPVLLLSGYGNLMFGASGSGSGLRVILTNHSWSFDDSVDYILVQSGAWTVKLPAMFSVQCDLTVVQTPNRMMNTFSFSAFASGSLLGSQGWI